MRDTLDRKESATLIVPIQKSVCVLWETKVIIA